MTKQPNLQFKVNRRSAHLFPHLPSATHRPYPAFFHTCRSNPDQTLYSNCSRRLQLLVSQEVLKDDHDTKQTLHVIVRTQMDIMHKHGQYKYDAGIIDSGGPSTTTTTTYTNGHKFFE